MLSRAWKTMVEAESKKKAASIQYFIGY